VAVCKEGAEKQLMLHCGIDIGSRTGKIVIIDSTKKIIYQDIIETVRSSTATYEKLMERLPADRKSQTFSSSVTGYGREAIKSETVSSVTEITCHFLGVHEKYPQTKTVIDIGGQDSKIITTNEFGRIADFIMNDRCAAGTGRFLEVMCSRIDMEIEEFADLDVSGIEPENINSTCTVFAESEVVSLMAKDVDSKVIASSIAKMVALNTASMAGRVHPSGPFFMSGGVSKMKPVKYHLEKILGSIIKTDDFSQLMGAYGAALFNMRKEEK